MQSHTKLINQQQIADILTLDEVFNMVDQTYRGLAEGTVKNPPKLTLDLGESDDFPDYNGFTNAMPAYLDFQKVVGLKWVGGNNGMRRKLGFPFIHGLIILQDPATGEYLAILDGELITSLRTGAQTAVSLSYITDKQSISLGMFGAGKEARSNIRAIANKFNIHELRIWNHRRQTAETLAEELKEANIIDGPIMVVDPNTPEKAAEADVLVTLTLSKTPIIQAEMVAPGTIIYPMGSYQEISNSVIQNADKIIVDHPTSALHRGALKALNAAGKLTASDLFASFPDLTIHPKLAHQIQHDDIVIMIPIGIGAVDIAVAYRAYELLLERGDALSSFNFLA